MSERTLTITLQPDWRAALRQAGVVPRHGTTKAKVLNFESAGAFFGRMTERRWDLVRALQGQGEISLRELARRVERDVKRVHEDVQGLIELGLIERGEGGGVICPFTTVHIDMELRSAAESTGSALRSSRAESRDPSKPARDLQSAPATQHVVTPALPRPLTYKKSTFT